MIDWMSPQHKSSLSSRCLTLFSCTNTLFIKIISHNNFSEIKVVVMACKLSPAVILSTWYRWLERTQKSHKTREHLMSIHYASWHVVLTYRKVKLGLLQRRIKRSIINKDRSLKVVINNYIIAGTIDLSTYLLRGP